MPGSGRKRGTLNRVTREVRDFARSILEADDYREHLRRRLIAGELSPQIETLLYHYAFGVPRREYGVDLVAEVPFASVPDSELLRQLEKVLSTRPPDSA